jgi:hypothetical protein
MPKIPGQIFRQQSLIFSADAEIDHAPELRTFVTMSEE